MAISGRKDEDDSKKASLEKAQQNGFGQPGVAGRKKQHMNEVFEELATQRLPKLVEKSFDAIERALGSSNPKVALDAAYKLNQMYYKPEQKIVVEGPDKNEIHNNILVIQDGLNDKEKAIVTAFKDLLGEGLKQEELEGVVIDGEAKEVELLELEVRDD